MRGLLGLLVTAAIVVVGYWYFASRMQPQASKGNPAQVISSVGVQSDLISIGQAERVYWAQHGAYASLDDLYSSGALAAKKSGRDGYTYSVETSDSGFTATARCDAGAAPGCQSYQVDQTMQVQPIQ
ncbi:MAG TPA: hypothetical protein VGR81_09910 [Candidatus Acidoferrales bacterium]|nr:hypothetical protein [Candidatus Acidoferrales bacterium]